MGKLFFDNVDPKPDFPAMENKLLEEWYKSGVVKKYLQKNNSSKKNFSFLDGPITANNPMGVHHAWGRTYKDLWQRYKNMQGYKQRFQNGFDCQGLWVEVEVEKELGFKSKKDIEKFGVEKFVQLCKDRVAKYSQIQTQQSKRLGYFMDWDNSYFTLSDENNYMIWYFLKKCHEKGLIYKGHDVVPWCPRCETAISEHEILTEDYKEITHDSIYLKYPVEDKNNEYLLIWTTTPWTLPANICVAVAEDSDYVLVDYAGEKLWLAARLKNLVLGKDGKIIRTAKGKELVGLKYIGPFDGLAPAVQAKKNKNFHTVIATDSLIMPISEEEGTGLVHTSTGTGAEDFKLGKKLGLPVIAATGDNADYLTDFGFLAGQNAKKHPEIIINYLESLDGGRFLFKTLPFTHRYPACWRCKNELIWKVADEWYIAIDPVREDMKKIARKIKWFPEFGLKRELDWLENMHDWLISKKNRYWGLALPIWECQNCKNFEIIGSKEELKQKAVAGWEKFKDKTPHKPWIDEVKIKCSKCGQTISRISDVGNPWLDAGIVTYSTIPSYLEDKSQWQKWVPVDFITESFPGQFKNWFYSLIAMSTVLENFEPFKSVLGFATLLAENGQAMHKSAGNMIEFTQGAEKIGADVMRWMFVRQNPADNLLFGYHLADETRRRFHLRLWNVYNFFVTYANLDAWHPVQSTEYPFDKLRVNRVQSTDVLDKWILIRLNQTISSVSESLEKYDACLASDEIEAFVDDLSLWYIRRSRDRIGPGFYSTCHFVLVSLTKLLAPFAPFMAEVIYRNLTKNESVHLADWPKAKILSEKDIKILSETKKIREVVEMIHAQRKNKGIPVRQPLGQVIIQNLEFTNKELIKLLADEVNVKKVIFKPGKGGVKIELDTTITPKLEEEAKTRELIRKIQEERKNLKLTLAERIDVKCEWLPKDKNLIDWLKKKAQIRNLTTGAFKIINV